MKKFYAVLSAVVLLCAAQVATADEVFVGSSGTLSATATFSESGGNLIITLTNTSTTDALFRSDILTGVYFSSDDATLTRVSATTGGIVYDFPGLTNVGSEWAYASGINAPGDATQGVSATGLGLFGKFDRFDQTTNLLGPDSPGGLEFGIAPAGDDPTTSNGGQLNGEGLIKNSVTFVLSGWSGSLASITDVWFQYGTSFTEPGFGGEKTPEPASIVLLGVGAAGLWFARRRKIAKA